MSHDPLRAELLELLDGHDAHMPFEAAVATSRIRTLNRRPPNVAYTPWHLVEHIRITQWDILDYIRTPTTSPRAGRWTTGPRSTRSPRPSGSPGCELEGFRADQQALRDLVADTASTCWR